MPFFGMTVFKVISSNAIIFKFIEYMMGKWQGDKMQVQVGHGGPEHRVNPK
jgi:hypothetical protein